MAKIKPIPEEIKEYLSYDKLTGNLTWIKRAGTRGTLGSIAGTVKQCGTGHVAIKFKGISYQAHRIAWFIEKGTQPPDAIDHINETKIDNVGDNLRGATTSENTCNRGKQSNNTSGYKGVSWHIGSSKWRAYITKDGKQYYLGYFDTTEEAYTAYCEASKELHGEFSNIG